VRRQDVEGDREVLVGKVQENHVVVSRRRHDGEYLLHEVSVGIEESKAPPRLDVLTALFGVPEVLIARRLAQFGLEIPAPRASASSGAPAESEAPALKPALPARYVHLAIAAWAHRLLERDRLALFLSVPEIETQAMIEWLGVERLPEHDETEN